MTNRFLHIAPIVIKYSLFVIFAAFLLKQCMLFDKQIYGDEGIDTGTLLMPLFIAGFVLISKRYWWIIPVFAVTTIWSIANLMYYSFFYQLLDVPAMMLANNMNGAWSLITPLWTHLMTRMCLQWFYLTLIVVAIEIVSRKFDLKNDVSRIDCISFAVCLVAVVILSVGHNHHTYTSRTLLLPHQLEAATDLGIYPPAPKWVPFGVVINTAKCSPIETKPQWKRAYVQHQSITTYLISAFVFECFKAAQQGTVIRLSETDREALQAYLHTEDGTYRKDYRPTRSICILLLESFESWPIGRTFEGKEITPNLNRLVQQEHILYCDRMQCQIRRGQSGDGQMLVTSGMLPLEDYVACMQYSDNTYPNYAHCYESSVIVNPWPHCWKQDSMTLRYGYRSMIEPLFGLKANWQDDTILTYTMNWMKETDTLFCALAISSSTHMPFTKVQTSTFATVTGEWPEGLVNYVRSVNYTDSCFGAFWQQWQEDELLQQSVLVITGDHTISHQVYSSETPAEVQDYAPDGWYLPFIVYSPDITGRHYIHDTCYQMDIFPTLMAVNGGETYYWQGFGNNLLADKKRNEPEEVLFDASAKMIKSDFFRTVENE